MSVKVLNGHTSAETAYVVEDYPYGFKLRCKIRYWIETTKHGQRFVSQTTNPKKPIEIWNKPKASTYAPIMLMYLDEQGYVQNDGISGYDPPERWFEKLIRYGVEAFSDPYRTCSIKLFVAAHGRYAAAQRAKEGT